MDRIGRAWRGEERLVIVYWVYAVLPWILLSIGNGVFLASMARAGGEENFLRSLIVTHGGPTVVSILLLIVLLLIALLIFNLVSIWRCAFNCDWTIFAYIVRFFVLLAISPVLFAIFMVLMR